MKFLQKRWRWLFGGVLGALCLAAALFLRVPALPAGFGATPEPTPAPTPASTSMVHAPISGAVTILADGAPVCTLPAEDEAVRLLDWRLTWGMETIPTGETLVKAAFVQQITLRAAVLHEEPIPYADAQALLEGDASLCPVRTVTRFASVVDIPYTADPPTEDKRLPQGERLVLQLGRVGKRATVVLREYVNGVRAGPPMATEETLIEPQSERVAVGIYTSSKPNEEPGRSEGVEGKNAPEGFKLASPCKGDIISNFGMRKNKMHNGLDYDANVGYEIVAPAAGTVLFAAERGSYGLLLIIDHGSGFTTRLSPLKDVTVKQGDVVEKGALLGLLAPPQDDEAEEHLHMELLIDGIPYNPRRYF